MSVQTLDRDIEVDWVSRLALRRNRPVAGIRRPRHQVLFRMAPFNLAAAAIVAACFVNGWAQPVFLTDMTGLTYVIVAVFLLGLGMSFYKAWQVSRGIDELGDGCPRSGTWGADYLRAIDGCSSGSRSIAASSLRAGIAARVVPVRQMANSLVILGLIGTVLGFIIALSGVSADQASDLSAVSAMVSQLIAGMSVALYTTLVGAVLNLWLMVNFQILAAGAVRLTSELVLLGESDERSRSRS